MCKTTAKKKGVWRGKCFSFHILKTISNDSSVDKHTLFSSSELILRPCEGIRPDIVEAMAWVKIKHFY